MPFDDQSDYIECEAAQNGFLDADLFGEECPGFAALLEMPVTMMIGTRHDQKKWKVQERTWADWLIGGEVPAWGLARHPEATKKDGPAIVLGEGAGGTRVAKAMTYMAAIGIDVDCGATLAEVQDALDARGCAAIVYTTFSDQKTVLDLPRDQIVRKMDLTGDPTLSDVQTYLREHDKHPYSADFIDAVKIAGIEHNESGVVVRLTTPPQEKFRVIFPLAKPVKIADLAPTQKDALDLWAAKCIGAAVELLGVPPDLSCTDPSRLFFLPRHPKGRDDWFCGVWQGPPLRFEDIPTRSKADYLKARDANPFAQAGAGTHEDRVPACTAPSGASLNDLHKVIGQRLLIADLLESEAEDRIRVAGGERSGHVHIECPWESEHSEGGGTACMAANAADTEHEYWTIWCLHDSCRGRHKLQFLEEMLRQGWFEEELLFDDAYLMASDGPEEDAALDALRTKPTTVASGGRPSGDSEGFRWGVDLFDARLVDAGGKCDAKNADTVRMQMAAYMRRRYAYVAGNDKAFAAERGGTGEPVDFITLTALSQRYKNRAVHYYSEDGKRRGIDPAKVWADDRARVTYLGTCFEPDIAKAPAEKFNLWCSFAVNPDSAPSGAKWSTLRGHLLDNICGGDEYVFNWTMTWLASLFQRPGVKNRSAIAVKGRQGSGKSKFFDWLRAAIGIHAVKIASSDQLCGRFNGMLDGRILVVGEEAFWSGDRRAAGALKDLITSDTLEIERKGQEIVTRPNYVNLIFISNNDWIVPTDGQDARRFLVLECSDARLQDAEFFAGIDAEMEAGGLEAMVRELMEWNPADHGLTWGSLRNPPMTEARAGQIGMGLEGPAARLAEIIEEGEIEGRTTSGAFFYELSEDEPTTVLRSHLAAALTGERRGVFGTQAKAVGKAIRNLLGENAENGDNKREVEFWRSREEAGGKGEIGRGRFVTIPAVWEARENLAEYLGKVSGDPGTGSDPGAVGLLGLF